MPMMLDTHTHLSTKRDGLVRDLKQRAYWGVSAALSLGSDGFELLDMRGQTTPGMARFFSAGKGISRPENRGTIEINSVDDARNAVREDAAHKVDIIKVWVDDRDGKVAEGDARAICRRHRRGAQERAARHRAHRQAGGRQGPDPGRTSMPSPTACATATSMTRCSRCTSPIRTWS